ncbi:MAG: hypothetical protein HIU91_13415 [Acidobacteria bacterium]|nr:hypothetical protein [Acidobacteriota bacterium]
MKLLAAGDGCLLREELFLGFGRVLKGLFGVAVGLAGELLCALGLFVSTEMVVLVMGRGGSLVRMGGLEVAFCSGGVVGGWHGWFSFNM